MFSMDILTAGAIEFGLKIDELLRYGNFVRIR